MGGEFAFVERHPIQRIGWLHRQLVRDRHTATRGAQSRLTAAVERAELRRQIGRGTALLTDVVANPKRVEVIGASRRQDERADEKGSREELERIGVIEAQAIAALELESKLRGALARFELAGAVFDVLDRRVVDILADGAASPWTRTELETRIVAPHVVAADEAGLGIEVVTDLQPFELHRIAIAGVIELAAVAGVVPRTESIGVGLRPIGVDREILVETECAVDTIRPIPAGAERGL